MNSPRYPLSTLLLCTLLLLIPNAPAHAGSATWKTQARNDNWNFAANWTPATVPNGPADTATLNTSSITDISLVGPIEVEGIVFNAGASAFTITCRLPLTISGTGITNNSRVTQSFTLLEDAQISVRGSASLGNATMTANGATDFGFGSSLGLIETATADHATLIANGGIFPGQPTSKGAIGFGENSTAAEATLIINPATVAGAVGGSLGFGSGATAGDSNITVNGAAVTGDIAQGLLTFSSSAKDTNATAANATITATAGSNGGKGGEVKFLRDGLGGTCRIELLGNSQLDMAPDRTRDLTIGSLEGQGTVFLGGHGLIIGSNNLSTTFSGQINDGQGGSTPPGSLSKIGTGNLELAGSTAYTGGTTVTAGALLVSNNAGSATGPGAVKVNGGTLGGGGIVSGAVTVGTGGGGGAFLAPAFGTNKQVTLTLQNTLTLQGDATYTYTFKARNSQSRTDLVIANGVTINEATIALKGKIQGMLTPGTILTVLSNTSANPISGTFSNLTDGAIVNANGNNLQASYTGGDGNDLTLTVVP
jgi:autotransporter-associated beta strand protein